MRLACGVGKGTGHQQQIGALRAQRAVELRETQVIANTQAYAPDFTAARRGIKHHGLMASLYDSRFNIALTAIVELEQMNFVVAGHAFALRRKGQTGVEHMLLIIGHQRQGAAHNPQAQRPRCLAQKILNRPLSKVFTKSQLVSIRQTHEAKILWQHGEFRTARGGLLEQAQRSVQIGLQAQA